MTPSVIAKSVVSRNIPVFFLALSSLVCVIARLRAMLEGGRLTDWLPTIFLVIAMLLWIGSRVRDWRRSAARRWLDQPLTRVEWRTFSNQIVVLDGKSFIGCSFSDLTLCYRGEAPFDFVNNHIRNVRIVVEHPRLFMLVQLLRYFSWIDRRAPITDGESNITYFGQQSTAPRTGSAAPLGDVNRPRDIAVSTGSES